MSFLTKNKALAIFADWTATNDSAADGVGPLSHFVPFIKILSRQYGST
jgi:hypothetical protein